jgi:GT2 family glycosyltransferase
MASISIVIVTWNCKKYIEECLESLSAYRKDQKAEIIVVDNASHDGTPELIRDSYPEVTLIKNDHNLGFAKANNVGLRQISGEYVCLINSDVRVFDGCIEKMLSYMERNPRIGLLGPRMLGPDGKAYRSYMGRPTLWRNFCRAVALDVVFPKCELFSGLMMPYFDQNNIAEVDVLNGWFWMTRREALNEVGLLDERLFVYGDDLDWSKRFDDMGWKVVYFPQAESLHYGGGSTARAPVAFSIEMQRANFHYWQKNFGYISQISYLCIIWIHQAFRVVGYSLLLAVKSKRSEAMLKIRRSLACLRWVMGFEDRRTELLA